MAIVLEGINGNTSTPGWITNELDKNAIRFAELFGKQLAAPIINGSENRMQALTTSQIRNVYGEVLRMGMKDIKTTSLLLLKPRLAYATQRKGTEGSKQFKEIIDIALNMVINAPDDAEKQKRFENFAAFFEAILAYHRSFGGK